jgi:outer membrane protein OmpA-like peptidoglycan-associated protein
MNTPILNLNRSTTAVAVAAAVSLVLAGCASAPQSPAGAAEVRSKLTRLQSNPNLGSRAPVALQEAETAVRIAEQPVVGNNETLGAHRVYMADRKVEIAIAQASTRLAEDQRVQLADDRERARLDARTREADRARADADAARAGAADAARMASADAEAARASAADAASAAARQADDLQRQIDALNAKATDRGLVLTLGDVLFASGRADFRPGAANNLNKLVAFLNQNPNRSVEIEGHTDSVGADDYNQGLSQRRADSVRSFLIQQGVVAVRLSAAGKGEHQPVADNESATGRQQNRRVEIIIGNPAAAVASN